jgi:hypothetical protein
MESFKKYLIKLLPFLTIIFVLLMLLSLKFRFLDIFVVGSWHGRIGNDFFSVPRSFLNLLKQTSMFSSTGFSSYGPYGGMYAYHPALSILAGSWLSLCKPWVSYMLFVIISIIILIYCGFLISKRTSNILIKRFAYFSILCTFPTYLMLWNAQMHVFTVLSATLIMVSLLDIFTNKKKYGKSEINVKLLIGLLASLFTKPIVILFFPILFFSKETRRTVIACLLVYTLVTAIFFIVPFLNPESDNIMHWMFFIHHSNVGYTGDSESFNTVTSPDYFEFFSLPTFIDSLCLKKINPLIYKIPIILVLIPSFMILFIKNRNDRILILLLTMILAIYSFYLSYTRIWEYFYTTLLPTIPIMAILYKKELFSNHNKILKYCLVVSISFYLPALFFLSRNHPYYFLEISRIIRLIPVVLIFTSLLFLIMSMLTTILFKKENIIKNGLLMR